MKIKKTLDILFLSGHSIHIPLFVFIHEQAIMLFAYTKTLRRHTIFIVLFLKKEKF